MFFFLLLHCLYDSNMIFHSFKIMRTVVMALAMMLALNVAAQVPDSLGRIRYKYDFVVPTNGNFIAAIHAANNRPDKTKRFRIFIKSSMYRIKGEGNPIKIVENGKELEQAHLSKI